MAPGGKTKLSMRRRRSPPTLVREGTSPPTRPMRRSASPSTLAREPRPDARVVVSTQRLPPTVTSGSSMPWQVRPPTNSTVPPTEVRLGSRLPEEVSVVR